MSSDGALATGARDTAQPQAGIGVVLFDADGRDRTIDENAIDPSTLVVLAGILEMNFPAPFFQSGGRGFWLWRKWLQSESLRAWCRCDGIA